MRRPAIRVLLALSAAWVGCSSERALLETTRPDFGDADGGAGIDAGCSGVVCSRDLRSVRDCSSGELVAECPPDKACGNGQCIAPCDAAAINEGSIGCAFAIPPRNSGSYYPGSCAAVFVANNWTSPATVRVEFKGEEKSLDGALWVPFVEDGIVKYSKLEGPIPTGGGAVVFVSQDAKWDDGKDWVGCPAGVTPIFDKEIGLISGTGIGHALFARADVPVSMYSMYPYGGAKSHAPSGTLLLPTTSFRKNYVAVSSWGGNGDTFGCGMLPHGSGCTQAGKPTLQIVATEDDTSVHFLPRVDIVGGNGVAPGPRNEVTSYKLQRGEFLQLTQESELVGSIFESDKPVGAFGGNSCMFAPADLAACDIDNKQIPPLSAWGHEYAVLPAPNRGMLVSKGKDMERDPSVIRIVGAANGTTLVYEPSAPEGAPGTLESGELARFFAHEPFVVRSQDAEHPFYVASVMTGAATTSSSMGDPETAVAIPTDQWLDAYGFFADSTYAYSSVFVTRRKSNGVFYDVTLDCAGALTGWKPISADYEWTYVELTRVGKPQSYPAGTCADGPHRISSEGSFTMAMWGLAYCASYSYPGGMGLRRVTELNIPVH
jgi:IgGFc binding protein